MIRPPEDKEKAQKEKERQAKLKRMAELKQRMAELDKLDKAMQKSAADAALAAAASSGSETAGSQTAAATKEKLGEVDALTSQLGEIEAMLDKEAISEVPTKNLEQIEAELTRLESEVAKEAQEKVQTAFDKLKELYPWIAETRMEFMYAIPPNPKSKDFTDWQGDWSRVLQDYARLTVLHVLYISKLLSEKPFCDLRDRDEAIKLIANFLVEKKLAKWITKSREEIRVYWKSMEELANDVEKWGAENAGGVPVIAQELKDADQVFSTIPEEEWDEIFKILKKRKKISVDKTDSGQIYVKFLV